MKCTRQHRVRRHFETWILFLGSCSGKSYREGWEHPYAAPRAKIRFVPIESNENNLSPPNLARFARRRGISLAWLKLHKKPTFTGQLSQEDSDAQFHHGRARWRSRRMVLG